MGFKIKGATVLAMAAAAGAVVAVKGLVKNQELKDELKEAGNTLVNDSREFVKAAGAVLNDAVKTVKETVDEKTKATKTEETAKCDDDDTLEDPDIAKELDAEDKPFTEELFFDDTDNI